MNDESQLDVPTPALSTAAMAAPVTAVSLKLPPYWPNDPMVWFAQVEAQFLTHSIISQTTKYNYVIASLQPEIAQEVRDVIINPPVNQPYDQLKAELIRRTSASEQRRFHQLLISEELGDKRPSKLLRKMQQLLGDTRLEDRIFRQLSLQRLPTIVRQVLASSPDTVSIEKLATIADQILEVATPSMPIAAISSGIPSSPSNEIADLRQQISTLTSQVQTLTSRFNSQPRSRSRSRYPTPPRSSRPRSSNASRHTGLQCWYHWRFGSAARNCTWPCSFTSTTQPQENCPASD